MSFPPNISDTRALLLHGNDRLRFMPKPGSFWEESPPLLKVKAWDGTLGEVGDAELSRMNINTNPLVDTLQSLHFPVGRFSDAVAHIHAMRYGCDGALNSGVVHDSCCVCGGKGLTCSGCDSIPGSDKMYDSCYECAGQDTFCLGCDYVPFSSASSSVCDDCVFSVGDSDNKVGSYYPAMLQDCDKQCFGSGLRDECGQCINDINNYNSDK